MFSEHLNAAAVIEMTPLRLFKLTLAILLSVLFPIFSLPTVHNIQKRATAAEILGDLTAGQSGVLNSPDGE